MAFSLLYSGDIIYNLLSFSFQYDFRTIDLVLRSHKNDMAVIAFELQVCSNEN